MSLSAAATARRLLLGDSHRLGQVAGLVHVVAAAAAVGEHHSRTSSDQQGQRGNAERCRAAVGQAEAAGAKQGLLSGSLACSPQGGQVVAEQLQGDDVDHGLQRVVDAGNLQQGRGQGGRGGGRKCAVGFGGRATCGAKGMSGGGERVP